MCVIQREKETLFEKHNSILYTLFSGSERTGKITGQHN